MTTRRDFVRLSAVAALASTRDVFAQVPVAPTAPVAPVAPVAPAVPPVSPSPGTPTTPAAPVTPAAPPVAGPPMSETEPQAFALGYVNDARRASAIRFPAYRPGQFCGSCQNYQGLPNSTSGPCAVFGGRAVMGSGWCGSYALRVG